MARLRSGSWGSGTLKPMADDNDDFAAAYRVSFSLFSLEMRMRMTVA